MRIAVRGFVREQLIFQEFLDVELSDEKSIEKIVYRHIELLKPHPIHQIEIEFLDEPDPLQRFHRLGTDPSGMVKPIFYPWKE